VALELAYPTVLELVAKLIAAGVIGGLIGFERWATISRSALPAW
jgi:uncharacterized membrane protein YhiD involved in acid resistance